ncbi:P-loop containing nucleoside triphosphate hydrolase protein, partial [Dendrothele bispora CBS 962.96]
MAPGQKKSKRARATQEETSGRTPIKPEGLENLAEQLCKHLGWSFLRSFQIDAIKKVLQLKDVMVHAGTGYGKTTIVAGPLLHPSSKEKITLLVSPLIALQNEQVKTFTETFRLKATAVNSSRGGCSYEVMNVSIYTSFTFAVLLTFEQDICNGKWDIVILSPEMLLSKKFIDVVLRNSRFRERVLSVVVDEAHVVSHWGEGFRKKYGELGIIRALLPPRVPVVAMSATLPACVRQDVATKLQFGKEYDYVNVGNNRANVSIAVRAMQHPMNTYKDLDFIIPVAVTRADDIPKTFLYADNVNKGIDLEDHLTELLPAALRQSGLIQTYSAPYSSEYRDEVMKQFREGRVRVLVCTDAAGMACGCDLPDIDVVVQWTLPKTVSAFVQRAGRAARGPHLRGLAILLVERSAYGQVLEWSEKKGTNRGKGKQKAPQSSKARKEYTTAHGINRAGFDKIKDAMIEKVEPEIDMEVENEGLYALVQTGICRRAVLTKIYNNVDAGHDPDVPCCDLCDPSLLERIKPAPIPSKSKKKQINIKQGIPHLPTGEALHRWRCTIFDRESETTLFGPETFMPNNVIELLASVGPIHSKDFLKQVVGSQWYEYESFGDELFDFLQTIDMPPMIPKPAKPRGKKRGPEEEAVDD